MEISRDLISTLTFIIAVIMEVLIIFHIYEHRKERKAFEGHRGFEPVLGAPADTKMPVRGSEHAAGYDFYAPNDILVPANGKSELVFFNVKAYMEPDEVLYMRIRSGLGTKHELMLETSGVIDADYYGNPTTDGNIATVFRNHGNSSYTIKKGERCCQGIFLKYLTADGDKTLGSRRGGYGSTGK